jgi:uncharacterized membrane protein YuzA (DUF378 family)
MKVLMRVSLWLLVIAGLAWGLEGLTEINLFDVVFLPVSHLLENGVEVLIGLAALLVGYDLLTKK